MIKEIRKLIKLLRGKSKVLYRSGWNNPTSIELVDSIAYISSSPSLEKKVDERIEKKPIEVFKEILSEEPTINLNGLDKQIQMVKRRLDFMRDQLGLDPADEKEALAFLQARKKYEKLKAKFCWATTTFSLIDALCKKYKVRIVDFQGYYKNVPMEAIDELEKFIDVYKEVMDEKLILKLIIDDGGKETKKDPILLAGSPFGKWYYVLGAWDKEVEIVDDLIYKGR